MVHSVLYKLLVEPLLIPKDQDAFECLQIKRLKAQTEAEVNELFKSLFEGKLQSQIKDPKVKFSIFQTFQVTLVHSDFEAVCKNWGDLRNRCQWIMMAEALIAMGGLAVARFCHHPLLILAGLTSAVAGFYLIGNRWIVYGPADEQYRAWKNPMADFTERRLEALQLPFSEMLEYRLKKGEKPRKGTVTDLELEVRWKIDFKFFAESMLKENPQDFQGQDLWMDKFKSREAPIHLEFLKTSREVLETNAKHHLISFCILFLNSKNDYNSARQGLLYAKKVLIK